MTDLNCEHEIERNEYGFPEMKFIREVGFETVNTKFYQYKLSEYELKCSLCGITITAVLPSEKGK